MTTEWLLDTWGEPDEIVRDADSGERWTYDRGLRWNGLAFVVGVPIPLILPVGRESDTFLAKDGVVESVDRVRRYNVGHLFGLFWGEDTLHLATDTRLERTESGAWVRRDHMHRLPLVHTVQ